MRAALPRTSRGQAFRHRRTARALSGMVSRDSYISFVLEEETSIDGLAETLTRLWIKALR